MRSTASKFYLSLRVLLEEGLRKSPEHGNEKRCVEDIHLAHTAAKVVAQSI